MAVKGLGWHGRYVTTKYAEKMVGVWVTVRVLSCGGVNGLIDTDYDNRDNLYIHRRLRDGRNGEYNQDQQDCCGVADGGRMLDIVLYWRWGFTGAYLGVHQISW